MLTLFYYMLLGVLFKNNQSDLKQTQRLVIYAQSKL